MGRPMTRVAATAADEVVLNLVTPEHVARVRAAVDEEARAQGRAPPAIAVWVSVALEPGEATLSQLAAQIAAYLAPPGYGESFIELGFEELVAERARGDAALRAGRRGPGGAPAGDLRDRVAAGDPGAPGRVPGCRSEQRRRGPGHGRGPRRAPRP